MSDFCQSVVLWSNGGSVRAMLLASRREAFEVTPVDDQTDMLAVKVTATSQFDPARDCLVRVVTKGTGKHSYTEDQLLCGTMPVWAGERAGPGERVRGTLRAPRACLADCSVMDVVDRVRPVSPKAKLEWLRRGLPLSMPNS